MSASCKLDGCTAEKRRFLVALGGDGVERGVAGGTISWVDTDASGVDTVGDAPTVPMTVGSAEVVSDPGEAASSESELSVVRPGSVITGGVTLCRDPNISSHS